jgi:hypothetical protein
MELQDIEIKIENAKRKSDGLKQQIEEIQEIVATKKEEYTLKEFLDHKVVEKLHELFSDNEREFDDNLDRLNNEIKEEEGRLKQLKGTNRIKMILELFNSCLSSFSRELGSSYDSNKTHNLGEKIKGSGSSHPRETLAYFFSYLIIMQKCGSPIMLPVVIDEFKQNGTTNESIDKMVNFAINHRPEGGQVIYSVSDNLIVEKEGVKVINLEEGRLMKKDDYKSVYDEVDEILNKNFKLK